MTLSLRAATLDDVPILGQITAESARALGREDYTGEQIEAALGTAWGVDTELIRDGTYFAVEDDAGSLIACGGWSRRRTLFGSDSLPGRQSEVLDPARDSARIRAFFVRPNWARRGVARALLQKCEEEARASGFRSAELVATLTGQRLYRTCGYVAGDCFDHPLGNGLTLRFVPMRKELA